MAYLQANHVTNHGRTTVAIIPSFHQPWKMIPEVHVPTSKPFCLYWLNQHKDAEPHITSVKRPNQSAEKPLSTKLDYFRKNHVSFIQLN